MKPVRFNLLTDEQLVALGLSRDEVSRVRQQGPIESLVDLLFVEGVDGAELIPRLVDQGVVVGWGDLGLLPDEVRFRWEQGLDQPTYVKPDETASIAQDPAAQQEDDDNEEDGKPPKETPQVLATGEGWTLASKAKDTLTPITDCSNTKTFEATAVKRGRAGEDGARNYAAFKAAAEAAARSGAKLRLGEAIGRIISECECTNKDCETQVIKVKRNPVTITESVRERGRKSGKRGGGPRYRGWKARAVASATVTVSCTS